MLRSVPPLQHRSAGHRARDFKQHSTRSQTSSLPTHHMYACARGPRQRRTTRAGCVIRPMAVACTSRRPNVGIRFVAVPFLAVDISFVLLLLRLVFFNVHTGRSARRTTDPYDCTAAHDLLILVRFVSSWLLALAVVACAGFRTVFITYVDRVSFVRYVYIIIIISWRTVNCKK
uniref:Uncharacterized protein n=1 Tax=Sipha flava TaxID=143950 RepID=A0A2S2Q8G7_9HEMI